MTIRPFILSAIAAAAGAGGDTLWSVGFVGANLNALVDYGDSQMYVDVIRNGRSFAKVATPYAAPGSNPNSDLAAVKANGWPSESFCTVILNSVTNYPAQWGTYEGSFTGTAAGVVGGSCVVQNVRTVAGNKTRFEVVVDGTQAAPYIRINDPSVDFEDLRLIRPGYAWDTAQVFTDAFLSMISSYSYLRTMDHQRTSGLIAANPGYDSGAQTTWASRWTGTSTPAGKVWARHSLEAQVELANTTNKDLWICLPHKAADDYISGALALVYSTLNPGLKLYVEYSNEIWNTSAAYQPQYGWCLSQGKALLDMRGGTAFMPNNKIKSIVVAGGVATVDLWDYHGKAIGDKVYIKTASGVPAAVYTIASVVGLVKFTVAMATADGTYTIAAGDYVSFDVASASISGNVCTVDFVNAHGKTTGQQIKAKIGSVVPAGLYTITATSSTQLTFPVTAADGVITMGQSTTFIVLNTTENLAYDFVDGSDGSGKWWVATAGEEVWGHRYAFRRIAQAKLLADAALPAGYLNRVRFIVPLQFAYLARLSSAITFLDQNYGPLNSWVYAISGAPYISASPSDTSVDSIIATLTASNESRRKIYYQWLAAATYYGVKFVPYEIGTDNVVATGVSSAVRSAANLDPRMSDIVRTMMLNASRMGASTACFYMEGAVIEGGGNFDLRQRSTDTVLTTPRLDGLTDALDNAPQTLDAGYWGTIPSDMAPADPYTDSAFCYYANNNVRSLTGIPGIKNLVFAAGSRPNIKAEFTYAVYCPADGNYLLTPQLGSAAPTLFKLEIDDVDQGISFTPPTVNADSVACTDNTPIPITLAKGWRKIKFISAAATTNRIGARQIKLTPA